MKKVYGNKVIESVEEGLRKKEIDINPEIDIKPELAVLTDIREGIIPKFEAQQTLIEKFFKILGWC